MDRAGMEATGEDGEETRVEAVHRQLRAMAVDFRLRPDERLNEGALARALGTSRTPLREALNRLLAEGLVTFHPGRGFCCRSLEAEAVFDLYELRAVLECAAVGLACARATEAALAALEALLAAQPEPAGRTLREVAADDEAFHLAIAGLSGNAALIDQLRSINDRIRFVRRIDLQSRLRASRAEHRAILAALCRRDAPAAVAAMQGHIARRMDQITAAVREGYAVLYVPGAADFLDRPLPAEATGPEEPRR